MSLHGGMCSVGLAQSAVPILLQRLLNHPQGDPRLQLRLPRRLILRLRSEEARHPAMEVGADFGKRAGIWGEV